MPLFIVADSVSFDEKQMSLEMPSIFVRFL